MEHTYLQAFVAAFIGALVNLLFWYGFNRREAKRDKEVEDLHVEVKTLRDEKIKNLDERLTADHKAHGELHEKINGLPNKFIPRSECELLCGGAIVRLEKTISSHAVQIAEVREDTTRTKTIVELIAERMNISIGGRPS